MALKAVDDNSHTGRTIETRKISNIVLILFRNKIDYLSTSQQERNLNRHLNNNLQDD